MPTTEVLAQQVQPLEDKGVLSCSLIPKFSAMGHWALSRCEQKQRQFLRRLKARGRGPALGGGRRERNCFNDYYRPPVAALTFPGGDEWNRGADFLTNAIYCNNSSHASNWQLPSNGVCAKASIFVCTDVGQVVKEEGRFRAYSSLRQHQHLSASKLETSSSCSSRGSLH